jgi:hypothetical protein
MAYSAPRSRANESVVARYVTTYSATAAPLRQPFADASPGAEASDRTKVEATKKPLLIEASAQVVARRILRICLTGRRKELLLL